MQKIALTAVLVLLPMAALASPAENLAEAKAEVAADHLYSADALLGEVVKSPDAATGEVEEALYLQSIIYSGDVLGAVAVMQPLALASNESSELKGQVSRQLLLARLAFEVTLNDYLDATVMGGRLDEVKLVLPAFTNQDVEMLTSTLADPAAIAQILAEYDDDPSAGQGLLARANQFGFFLAISASVPEQMSGDFAIVRSKFSGGLPFDRLHYLDWAARVALDMHALVQEPGGPDLLGLAKRCDERIRQIAGDDPANQYVKNALDRASMYGQLSNKR
ncbi:hypothetical protein IIA79_06295 [bacterium]|nr:hypothetical protein [bacterium]